MKLGLLACLAVAAAFGSGAPREPDLKSASQRQGHIVVRFSLGSLAAGQVVAAKSPRRSAVGALMTGVVLRARLPHRGPSRVRRWRSRQALPAGVYFVQVSGVDSGGVTDCPPHQVGCGQSWSNVRRVTVPAKRARPPGRASVYSRSQIRA